MSKWKVLFVTTTSTSLVFLDNSIMPIAIPTIAKELHLSMIGGMWVVNAYLLALVSFLFIGGKLVDVWGKKKIYLIGYALFALASMGGALSQSASLLITSRALQGIGGALILPTTSALLIATFPLHTRTKAIGLNAGISSLFLMLGPFLGGFLTSYCCWRYIFAINLPILLLGLWLIFKVLPNEREKKGEKLKLIVALPLIFSLATLIVGLMEGGPLGWKSPITITLFCVAILSFLTFMWLSHREKNRIIDFGLFKNPFFYTSTICIFITQLTVIMVVLWSIYFQEALFYSPFEAGLLILLAVSPVVLIAPLSGFIADSIGPKIPICCGFIFLIFSFIWLVVFANSHATHTLFPGLIAFGCGIPLIYSPAYANAMTNISSDHLGGAASIITMIRQLAATLGIALMTALFHSVHESSHSYTKAFSSLLFLGISLAFLGFMMALFIAQPKNSL